ncbi:MAG: hypothetical protein KJ070_08670 [Verrucomicrobia bacterium]|nr:hypothetical protein [Verrucomicrobiota bacterium]
MNTKSHSQSAISPLRTVILAGALLLGLADQSLRAQTCTVIHSFGTLSDVTGFHPTAPLVQGSDGTLYGTMSEGEYSLGIGGTVFKIQPDGSGFAVLKHFTNYAEAWGPLGGLVLDGQTLYGTTEGNGGAVFKLNTDGSDFSVLKAFLGSSSEGIYPYAGLAISGTTLYGTTFGGGNSGLGVVFKVNTDGSGFTVLHRFARTNGVNPYAPLVISGATLYGTTSGGGANNKGTVFKLDTSGTGFTVLRHLATADGASPYAGLALSGDTLYGTAPYGGPGGAFNQFGTVFKLHTDGTGFQVLKSFVDDVTGYPTGQLLVSGATLFGTVQGGNGYGAVFKLGTDGSGFEFIKDFAVIEEGTHPVAGLWLNGTTLFGTTRAGGADDVGTLFKVNTDGSGFAVLKNLTFSREGVMPRGGLVASGSTLYGTTRSSAHERRGTVFKLNMDGDDFTVLKSFGADWTDAAEPMAGLVLAGDTLFGTTIAGGEGNEGTVFRINTDGSDYAVLHSFSFGVDGFAPQDGLACSGDTLYGTTSSGGSGNGSIFKLNTNGGGFTVLKRFDGDAGTPASTLAQSGSMLFGTTFSGGSVGQGTIFRINTDGSGFTVLKDYDGADGAWPQPGLILSGDTLYGMTALGGSMGAGTVFKLNTNGSGYTVLKEFDPFTEGSAPYWGLTLHGTTLYGCTSTGGAFGRGTVFKLETDGSGFAVLKEFTDTDGGPPSGPLLLVDSALYGTTEEGGHLNAGVVFRLALDSTPEGPPRLSIRLAENNTVVLTWPDSAVGFELQANDDLVGSGWALVSESPVQIPGQWQVTISPATGNRFYRLHKP